MAATVCPAPQFVGLDNSGNPLSGGKLYSYASGTTTLLSTFSDSALSVANANPVILDAGGRATVYLSASSYKFKLTTSGDDVIYTQDDVIAPAPYDVDLDVPFVAGEAVTAGQAIYLSDGTGSRTDGRWYLTDSDTAAYSTLPITGFAVAAVALAATGSVRLLGHASVPGTLSVGSTYYLGATPGAIASSAGTFSKAMGVADTASTLVMTVQQTISQVANLLVTGTLTVNGVATFDVQPIVSSLTASRAVFTDGSKGLVSNAITGTGNVVMSASPTTTGTIGAAAITLTTPLAVASGGTGLNTLTSANLLVGAGTSDVTFIAPGSSANVLTSNGSVWSSSAPAAGWEPLSACEGRLTATSGLPVTTADVSAATSIYYTPYVGNKIALYDGSSGWDLVAFTEITISLSGLTASKPYDIFCYNNSGTATIETLVWTDTSTRATALVVQNGVLVKTGATTRRYLGTIFINASGAQTDDTFLKRYIWNMYNRVPRVLRRVTATTSWTYSTATVRQAAADTANQVEVIIGVAEVPVAIVVQAQIAHTTATVNMAVGLGEDSTTTVSTSCVCSIGNAAVANKALPTSCTLDITPAAGHHYYAWLEWTEAVATGTFYGQYLGVSPMLRSGISGTIDG